jgi:hypothetical protein
MAESFELKKLWIPLEASGYQKQGWGYLVPVNNAQSEAQWHVAQQMAREGWELVSGMPITGQRGGGEMGGIYTVGYILLFKRRISSDAQPRK